MEVDDVQTIRLAEFMADKAPLWETIVEKYGLQRIPYDQIAAWPFADYVFGTDWDVMTDTLKLRLHGFHDCLRSDAMFERIFDEFRDMKVIPRPWTVPTASAASTTWWSAPATSRRSSASTAPCSAARSPSTTTRHGPGPR